MDRAYIPPIQASFLSPGSLLQAGFPCTSKVKLRLQRWDRVHDFQLDHIILGETEANGIVQTTLKNAEEELRPLSAPACITSRLYRQLKN